MSARRLAMSACLCAGLIAAAPAAADAAPAPTTPDGAPSVMISAARTPYRTVTRRTRTAPAPTPAPTATPSPTPTPTPSPTNTVTPNPTPTSTPAPQPLGAPGTYTLKFHDEFDGTSLNTSVWTPRRGVGANNFGTPFNLSNEDAGFQPGQVSVGGGTLKLTAAATPTTVNDPWGVTYSYPYTSGVVNSEAGFTFTYGYIETRMWGPDDAGYWPAFWMVAPGLNLPEVDAAEFFTGWDGKFHPHVNLHWGADWSQHQEYGMQMMGTEGQTYGGGWHTYGLKWAPGSLQTYVDGVAGPVVTSANVPSTPLFVLLNLSVRKGATPAPATMQVDYVRVWQ